jgi:hypothetical protein
LSAGWELVPPISVGRQESGKLVTGDADRRAVGFVYTQPISSEALREAGDGLLKAQHVGIQRLDGGDDG